MKNPLLLLSLCLAIHLSAPSAHAVKGGELVLEDDPVYKITVGLIPVCTAFLIADDLALTATHCFHQQKTSAFIYFGRFLRDPAAIKRKVLGYESHPGFRENGLANDITLVRFEGGLPEGFGIVSIASQAEVAAAKEFVAVGYGLDENHFAGQLKKTTLPLSDKDFFDGTEPTRVTLAMSPATGVCQGDSGGPMYVKTPEGLKVGALLNFVDSKCAGFAVGTKISYYEEWIRKTAQELRKAPN